MYKRQGVGGDRILEATAVGVALNHDLDERAVDHVHLRLAVTVAEVHLTAADDAGLVRKVRRDGPVAVSYTHLYFKI